MTSSSGAFIATEPVLTNNNNKSIGKKVSTHRLFTKEWFEVKTRSLFCVCNSTTTATTSIPLCKKQYNCRNVLKYTGADC